MRDEEPGWLDRMGVRASRLYQRFVASRWFFLALILGAVALSLLAFSVTSGIMSVFGLVITRRSLPVAYQWLKRAVLVSILLVQVPLFYL
jgi:hypothetical protein